LTTLRKFVLFKHVLTINAFKTQVLIITLHKTYNNIKFNDVDNMYVNDIPKEYSIKVKKNLGLIINDK
jgi:putative heme iron utilization protein